MQVFSKSIPRSGHHFLQTLAMNYFGAELRYCFLAPGEDCCNLTPCNRVGNDGLFLKKSHDSRLDEPTDVADVCYLVQTREPVGHLLSLVEMLKRRRGAQFPIEDEPFSSRWIDAQAAYYSGFIARWVTSDIPNRLIIDYDDLLQTPQTALASLVRLYGREPDTTLVQDVVERNKSLTAHDPRGRYQRTRFETRDRTRPSAVPLAQIERFVSLVSASGS